MTSEGLEGRGTSYDITFSSFGVTDVVAVRMQCAISGACFEGVGAQKPSTLGEGALGE